MTSENKLFSNVKYVLTGDIREEVKLLLQSNGAERYLYFSDYVTHCIVGENPRGADVSDAVELYEIPAVTQEWVTYSHKCNKLLPTSGFIGGCSQLFTGVVATFSKVSQEDKKKLWAMLKFYGGTYSSTFKETNTHLIVTKAEGLMYQQAQKLHGKVSVVTPDWLVDSIRGGYLLDPDLYHPRLLLEETPSTSETQCVQPKKPIIYRPWEEQSKNNVISSSKSLEEPRKVQHGRTDKEFDRMVLQGLKPSENPNQAPNYESDEKSNFYVLDDSIPLKKIKLEQPCEFDDKHNIMLCNYLAKKDFKEPLTGNPLNSMLANGQGIVKPETSFKPEQDHQEAQTYNSSLLKPRLSVLSNVEHLSSVNSPILLEPQSAQAALNHDGDHPILSPSSDESSWHGWDYSPRPLFMGWDDPSGSPC